jgi:hypothetical protein
LTLINLDIKCTAAVILYQTLVYVEYGTARVGPSYRTTHQLGLEPFAFLDLALLVAVIFDRVTAA